MIYTKLYDIMTLYTRYTQLLYLYDMKEGLAAPPLHLLCDEVCELLGSLSLYLERERER